MNELIQISPITPLRLRLLDDIGDAEVRAGDAA
jgi:hypothetical protein